MLSRPARYIHPAAPVYHVQPARAGVEAVRVDVAGDDVRFGLVAFERERVRVRLTGLSMWKSSTASSPLPSRAEAMTTQTAACVYWPPFSRMPGRICLDVTGVFVRTIERRSQQEQGLRAAVEEMRADCVHRALGK